MDRPQPLHKFRRFSDCSVSEKFLDTCFLLIMGLGYLLALSYLYVSHEGLDGKPGLSSQDVVYTYYGNRSGSMLESKLMGSMSGYISIEENEKVVAWIFEGSPEKTFDSEIKPIFEKNCTFCHSPDGGMTDLSDVKAVKKLTDVDMGKSIGSLARVSHIHLFGIGLLLFLIGKIFILCEIPVLLKRAVVGFPFLAIFMDIGSWWLTHWLPAFAYIVIAGGALMGLSIGFQIIMSLYQMWFYKEKVL